MQDGYVDKLVVDWVERKLGPVESVERQGRWRPSWRVTARFDGVSRPLYVRGARGGDWPPLPLSYECSVFQIFERNGVRVPHVYGYIDEVPAIVMDLVPGQPDLSKAGQHTKALQAQLIEQMALIHAIDPAYMAEAGAPCPSNDDEIGISYFRSIESLFVNGRDFPCPAVEFVRLWLNRNIPANTSGPRTVTVDAAQFVYEGNRLTAMLDFEFAGIGDFHSDLAALRIRNRAEFLGDVDMLIEQYRQHTGEEIDYQRIRYHTAVIAILTPLQVAREIQQPKPGIDYHEYLIWYCFCTRLALEAIYEMLELPLAEFVPPAEPRPSRYTKSYEAFRLNLQDTSEETEFARYQRHKQRITLRFLERCDAYQQELEARYLDDVARLTGTRAVSPAEADRVLESFVASAGPEHDTALLSLFIRQFQGACFLLADSEDQINYTQVATPLQPLKELVSQ